MSAKKRIFNLFAAFLLLASSAQNLLFINNNANAVSGVDPLAPSVKKDIKSNGDGTYTISFDVTGKDSSTTTTTKANVVIVLDSSGSMDKSETIYGYAENTYGAYGYINNEYVQLYYHWKFLWIFDIYSEVSNRNDNHDTVYYSNNGSYTPYNGTRYRQNGSTTTRLDVAKIATNSLVGELLSKNTTSTPDMVEVALIDFATNVKRTHEPSTNQGTIQTWINQTTADGGTNWETALNAANNINFGDNDTTYVIFVSDGNPTFRDSANGYDSDYRRDVEKYGTGNSDPNNRNLNAAKNSANNIIEDDKKLYTVGTFGDANRMRELHSSAQYFDATDRTALIEAFANIASSITTSNPVTYAELSLIDPITAPTGIDARVEKFEYYKNGESWTPETEARFENGEVIWNLGETKLSTEDVLTLEFVVYPNQDAVDNVANHQNNSNTKLDNAITEDYKLHTNGEATFRYKTADMDKAATLPIANPDPININTENINIQKIWEDDSNAKDYRTNETIKLVLNQDDEKYADFDISASDNNTWGAEKSIVIAPGLIVDENSKAFNDNDFIEISGNKYTILNQGHNYQLSELNTGDHYSFSSNVYHPMYLNGKLHNIFFNEKGEMISVMPMDDFIFTGANTLNPIGDLEITKIVIGTEDNSKVFTFNIELKDNKGNDISNNFNYCILDDDECVSTSRKPITDNQLQIPTNSTIRISNLPVGASYDVSEIGTEGVMPKGYKLDGATGATGTIIENQTQSAKFTNSYSITEPTSVSIVARKEFGDNWLENEFFTFILKKGDETIGESQNVFKGQTITFKIDNITNSGTTHYTIEETAFESFRPGVTNKTNKIPVTVCASDNGDGTLSAEVFYNKHIDCKNNSEVSETEAIIENDYDKKAATGKAEIVARKILQSYDFNNLSKDDIEFTLTDEDDKETTEALQNCSYLDNSQRDSICEVIFTLDYNLDDLDYANSRENGYAREYHYEITETKSPDYLKIEDDQTLEAVVKIYYDEQNNQITTDSYFIDRIDTIVNAYTITDESEASIIIPVTKILEGRDWLDSDEFVFTLEKITLDEDGNELYKKISDVSATKENQIANFTLSYELEDIYENNGNHRYRISEKDSYENITNGTGIIFDIEVSTDNKGKLTASGPFDARREALEECKIQFVNFNKLNRAIVDIYTTTSCPESWLDRDEEFTITNIYTKPSKDDPKIINPNTNDNLTAVITSFAIMLTGFIASAYIVKKSHEKQETVA